MKSFQTMGSAWLACTLLLTAHVHGQGLPARSPSVLSYPNYQALSSTHFAAAAATQQKILNALAVDDGAADDGVYGASTTRLPVGKRVLFYVEARAEEATNFHPEEAEASPMSRRLDG